MPASNLLHILCAMNFACVCQTKFPFQTWTHLLCRIRALQSRQGGLVINVALRRGLRVRSTLAVVHDSVFGTQDPDSFTFDNLRAQLRRSRVGVELDQTVDAVTWHDDLGDQPPHESFARHNLPRIVYLGGRDQDLMTFQPPAYGLNDNRLADGLFDAKGKLDGKQLVSLAASCRHWCQGVPCTLLLSIIKYEQL